MRCPLTAVTLAIVASVWGCVPDLRGFDAAAACADGERGQSETDLDCGGTNLCPRCQDGLACSLDSDCRSQACSGGVCVTAHCGDGEPNAGETDVDCGGPTPCARCGDGLSCEDHSDCASARCQQSTCRPPSCGDGDRDGDETDEDCGGSCGPCDDGLRCATDRDCTSGLCVGATCIPAKCADERLNGGETDRDCGGETGCARCADGLTCSRDSDCASAYCLEDVCAPATCNDGNRGEGESDVDCGGEGACARCGNEYGCERDTDCASSYCEASVCLPATCGDGRTDAGETDTDCGGATLCSRCANGSRCVADGDCASQHCSGSRCVPEACVDGDENDEETDADCGGPTCAPCPDRAMCAVDRDCKSGHCYVGVCAPTMTCDYVGGTGANSRKVRLVYLVPSDRPVRAQYVGNLERAVRHVQVFMAQQLLDARTFSLASPIVTVLQSSHDTSWFNTPRPPTPAKDSFYQGVLDEVNTLLAPSAADTETRVIYADIDPICGQVLDSVFSYTRIAPANDLRGLSGIQTVPACAGESSISPNPCRFVGGLARLLALSWNTEYPAFLSYPEDLPSFAVSTLDRNLFFGVEDVPGEYCDCSLAVPE